MSRGSGSSATSVYVATPAQDILRQSWALRKAPDPKAMVALLSPVPKETLTQELELAHLLSWGLRELGEFQKSLDLQLEMEPLFRARGNDWLLRYWLLVEGTNWEHLGNAEKALASWTECMDLASTVDDQYSLAWCTNNIAIINAHQGNFGAALANLQRAVAASHRMGYLRGLAFGYHNLTEVHIELGRYGQAFSYVAQAADYARKLGIESLIRWHDVARARVFVGTGDLEAGRLLLTRSYNAFSAEGTRYHEAVALGELGAISLAEGNLVRARRELEACTLLARNINARVVEITSLIDLALVEDREGNVETAAKVARETRHLLGDLGSTFYLDRHMSEFSIATRFEIEAAGEAQH